MHETGIAQNMVKSVLAAAEQHGLQRVSGVFVTLGALQNFTPDHLQSHFREAAEGTIAADARVHCDIVPGRARCLACGHEFPLDQELTPCPQCHDGQVKVISGMELIVDGLEAPD
jgi:hydrogenase nickel incorporation protein HypA/HybF